EVVWDLGWCAAAHVVAVVAATVVVSPEPGVGLGLQLADAGEAATVEGGPPAFLQGGSLEAFAHRVVVRGTRRDPMVLEAAGGEVGAEPAGDPLGSVVGEHRPHWHPEASERLDHVVDETDRVAGGRRADDDQHDRPAGGDIDGGQLVHLADAFEVADVEAVGRYLVAGSWAAVAEPERLGVSPGVGGQSRRGGGDRRGPGHPLGPAAGAVAEGPLLARRLSDR